MCLYVVWCIVLRVSLVLSCIIVYITDRFLCFRTVDLWYGTHRLYMHSFAFQLYVSLSLTTFYLVSQQLLKLLPFTPLPFFQWLQLFLSCTLDHLILIHTICWYFSTAPHPSLLLYSPSPHGHAIHTQLCTHIHDCSNNCATESST